MKECTIALLCNVTLFPKTLPYFYAIKFLKLNKIEKVFDILITNYSTKTQPQTHGCLSMFKFFKEIRKDFLNSTGNSQGS